MGKFVIEKVEGGYIFRLLSGAAKVICTSVVYTKLIGCLKAIESIRKGAKLIDDRTEVPVRKRTRVCRKASKTTESKFEVVADKTGGFKFRFVADYGQVIVASHTYLSKSDCLRGIAIVKENAARATVAVPQPQRAAIPF